MKYKFEWIVDTDQDGIIDLPDDFVLIQYKPDDICNYGVFIMSPVKTKYADLPPTKPSESPVMELRKHL